MDGHYDVIIIIIGTGAGGGTLARYLAPSGTRNVGGRGNRGDRDEHPDERAGARLSSSRGVTSGGLSTRMCSITNPP